MTWLDIAWWVVVVLLGIMAGGFFVVSCVAIATLLRLVAGFAEIFLKP